MKRIQSVCSGPTVSRTGAFALGSLPSGRCEKIDLAANAILSHLPVHETSVSQTAQELGGQAFLLISETTDQQMTASTIE
jgi:hypothetical protein